MSGMPTRDFAARLWLSVPWLLTVSSLYGQTNNSYPMLMNLRPAATQIGQSTDHELSARYNLAGATQILVSGQGVTGEILVNDQEKPEDKSRNDVMASKCKVRFTVAPDALPGVRDFRVMTPHGVSTLGQLVITRDPILIEAPDNDVLDKAQIVTLPSAWCGAIEKGEDVDFYKFAIEAGAEITYHMRSQRLLNRLHDMQIRIDPMITLRHENGNVIAASDNFYAGDPLLHHRFEAAGNYILEVRDVRYQGNADWSYVVEANDRPFVTQTFPMVGLAGQATNVEWIGFPSNTPSNVSIAVPTNPTHGLQWITTTVGGRPTNEFPFLVSQSPILHEVRPPVPSSTATDGTVSKQIAAPMLVSFPGTLSGRIDQPGEIDRYVFECKAQEKLSFEIIARRANSGLDPKIRITNEAGGVLVENDDAVFHRIASPDSWIENWTAPADGKYILEVRDLHQRGGPSFVYAIEATRAVPYFLLEADTDKSLLAPGMSSVIYVRGHRRNGFVGPIELTVQGLPAYMTATNGIIQSELSDGCVLLHAAADAPNTCFNIEIRGTGKQSTPTSVPKEGEPIAGEPIAIEARARPMQEYYLPGGGRGNYPVDMHTVSIAQPMDLRSIKTTASELILAPGESKRIDITVERAPDFKGNVTLDVLLQHLEQPFGNSLPKGVTVDVGASKTLLTAGETSGFITLKAANDAKPVDRQLVPINAHVSINFVMKHTLCGPPLFVSVQSR